MKKILGNMRFFLEQTEHLICIYIYILKIQGPVGLRLWNEFSTFEYKNSPYIGARIEFVKKWLERECISIGGRSQINKQDINQQLYRKLHIGENLDM